jgi:hypothetical protein
MAIHIALESTIHIVGIRNCFQCRAEMSTDAVLSRLRCAECRQIRFERFCDVAFKTALVFSVGWLVVMVVRRSRIAIPRRRSSELSHAA